MDLGKEAWQEYRISLIALFTDEKVFSRYSFESLKACLHVYFTEEDLERHVHMHLPIEIGDYTDFYASKEHATNVGTMFRGKENALNPNW